MMRRARGRTWLAHRASGRWWDGRSVGVDVRRRKPCEDGAAGGWKRSRWSTQHDVSAALAAVRVVLGASHNQPVL